MWKIVTAITVKMFHKLALTAALVVVVAGCGGGSSGTTATAPPARETAPPTTPSTPARQPTATTGLPPKHHRKKPQPLGGGSSTAPLRVTSRYTCNGKRLRAIAADGPVKVKPAIVKPGQSFAVIVTDPSAKVALVSLAGVAPKPIQSNATQQNGKLSATLRMPSYATCGNKLLEVEGDVSVEAYVGVSR
ncbi:MAG TPA: hypothetical protein VFL87_00695 [Thermoleophilaceae bacterium]|nr:hypothetical protein [Thermoleophilaceae bacterium]